MGTWEVLPMSWEQWMDESLQGVKDRLAVLVWRAKRQDAYKCPDTTEYLFWVRETQRYVKIQAIYLAKLIVARKSGNWVTFYRTYTGKI